MRTLTGSCRTTRARARSGPTLTCWLITCGGWSASACRRVWVTLRDLQRYIGIIGAEVRMPLGEPWRAGKRPYGPAALSAAAACLKGFYLYHAGSTGSLAGGWIRRGCRRGPTTAGRCWVM